MPTPYEDLLGTLSGGAADAAAASPPSYNNLLSSLSGTDQPNKADDNDWWGAYWGNLKDSASAAYHAASKNEPVSMPKADAATLTGLLAGRGKYLDEIDAASTPTADSVAKDKAKVAAARLARIDQVLGFMGSSPDQASTTDAPAADQIAALSHGKLMASKRYQGIYNSASDGLMPEDQRREYARATLAKEARDLPYQRDSILADLAGAPKGSAFAARYGGELAEKQAEFYRHHDADVPLPAALQGAPQDIAPEPTFSERAAALGHTAVSHTTAGALAIPAAVNTLLVSPPAILYDAVAEHLGGDATAAQDWVFKNLVEPDSKEAAELRAGAVPHGVAEKVVAKLGDLAGPFVLAAVTRNPQVAQLTAPADLTALQTASANVAAQVPGAATMALPGAAESALQRAETGTAGDHPAAEFTKELAESTVYNTMPMAAPGSFAARLAQGGGAQAALGTAQRAAAGQATDAGDVLSDIAIGGAMGGLHAAPDAPQSVADVAAAREGFRSADELKALTAAHGAWEAKFSKVLDQIGDNPEAVARADYALSALNAKERTPLWTMAELKHIADTGQSRDEATFENWSRTGQFKISDEAAGDAAVAQTEVGQAVGATPEDMAAERASEEQAAANIGMAPIDAPESPEAPRFRLDVEDAEAPDPNLASARPEAALGDLPDLPYPHVTNAERAQTYQDLGAAVTELAKAKASRQLPDAPDGERSLEGIVGSIAPDVEVASATNTRGNGALYHLRVPGSEKPATLVVEPSGRLQFDVSNLNEGSGYGARLYHAINTFAHRNGLKAAPDDAGLSEINTFRRTEHQLASAARTGDTTHLVPDSTQGLRFWKRAGDRGNTPEESLHNTGHMAHVAMDNVLANDPALSKMRYNFDSERFEWTDGRPVHEHDFRRIASSDNLRPFGGGSSTLKRAVWTASLLRAGREGGRIRDLAQASRERLDAGWRGAGDVALDRVRYRLSGREGGGEQAPEVGAEPAREPAAEALARREAVPAEGATEARLERSGRDGGGAEAAAIPREFSRSGEAVDRAAHESATSPLNERAEPTERQAHAGNYKKGRIRAAGLDISIENPRGSVRSGVGPDGRPWSRTMNHHYGYIRGTVGADGSHVDVLLGDQPHNITRKAFVVDQMKPDGSFDEHKVLLGFRNENDALRGYHSEYPKGWKGAGRVRAMTAPELKTWLKSGARDEAAAGPLPGHAPRVTLRSQQPDATTVHVSAEGDVAKGGPAALDRLKLPNAGMPSRKRVTLSEVAGGGKVPAGHGSAVLRNIYDRAADPRGLEARARAELKRRGLPDDQGHLDNEFERQVVAQGFDGYREDGRVTVLGHDVPLGRVAGEAKAGAEEAPRAAPSGKLSKPAAEGLVKILKWHRAREGVEVHESEKSLPEHLRDMIPAEYRGRVHGFYDPATRKVHVIADKMTSPRELYRTLAEEHLSHGGLRQVFQPAELHAFLDRAFASVPRAERAAIARDYHLSATSPEGRRVIAEEYLAKIDPASVGERGMFERFRDWFNERARKMGMDVDYSPSELRAVMQRAHDAQRAGLSPSPASKSPVDLTTPRYSITGRQRNTQIDTPEFKKWFGESRVVDENGDPLVVYKGMHPFDWREESIDNQGPEITSFDKPTLHPAFNNGEDGVKIAGFFGDKDTANRFAKGSLNGAVYPVYLKMENPFEIHANGEKSGNIQFGESGREFRDAIRSGKYDGVIIHDTSDEGTVYVAIKPESVKSAIGNTGSFDPSNPDIRFRVGRQKGTPEQEAAMARTMSTPHEDLTLGDRARRWVAELKDRDWAETRASWVQGWLDSGNQVKRLEREVFGGMLADASESPYKMYNLARNSHAVMGAVMKLGVPEYKDGAFQPVAERKGVFEVFRPLYEHSSGKSLMPLWEFYASARRASRLINEKNADGTARENNFTQEDIDRGLELAKQYPEFEKVASDFEAFNKELLELAVDRGALSRAEADAWSKHFYVPFMRAVEDVELAKAPSRRRGSAASDQKIYSRRLTGQEARVDSVFENILANTAYVLDRTYRQEFMNRLRDMGDGTVLQKVPMANKAIRFSNEELARALWKGGLIVGSDTTTGARKANYELSQGATPTHVIRAVERMSQAQKDEWTTVFQRVAPRDADVVPIMSDGKTEYYRVTDPLLLRTIGAMGHDSFGSVVSLLSGAKKAVTWSITKDPGFMAATWFRDTLINWVSASSEKKIIPFVDNAKAAVASFREDPIVDKMMMAGVGVSPYYHTGGSTVRKQLEQRFGGKIISPRTAWDFYNRIGMAAESSSRIAIARSVLERGGSMAEAAYQAQDILNYSMRGDYAAARVLTMTAPFWNAGMQGLYRFMRGAGVSEARAGQPDQLRTYALRGAALVAATMANMWRNQDDPRYNRLTQEDKDNYWHFWIGDQHWKLPKPFEAGVIFGTLPERIYQRAVGNDTTRDLMRSVAAMITGEMRLNVLPQGVRQGVEQWANKDTSSFRPIVPASMSDQLPQDQFSPYTSWSARAIANAVPEKTPWLNSPTRVQALVRGLTGTLGVYVMQGADWMARQVGAAPGAPAGRIQDLPVAKRFYAGSGEGDRSKYEDKMYELREEADQTFQSFSEAAKRGDAARARELAGRPEFKYRGALDEMSRTISQLRGAEKQVISNPFLGPDDKREQLDRIVESRVKLLDRYGPLLNKLEAEF